MKNLTSRIISALIALILFITILYFGGAQGVHALVYFIVARGSYEVVRMLFKNKFPDFANYGLILISLINFTFLTFNFNKNFALFFILASFIAIVFIGIIFHKKFKDITSIINYISNASLSLIYTSLIPAIVVWTVYSEQGILWFLCLLAVVFAGDIGAFLFGVSFGKTKLAPSLSPNKSLQGSLGGLLFSTLIAYGFSFYLLNTPVTLLLFCGLLGGALGQLGDFLESLIKRVSGVKDSGTIMPGHGGVLDRIDGVLLAAPLFYFAANYHSLWS